MTVLLFITSTYNSNNVLYVHQYVVSIRELRQGYKVPHATNFIQFLASVSSITGFISLLPVYGFILIYVNQDINQGGHSELLITCS